MKNLLNGTQQSDNKVTYIDDITDKSSNYEHDNDNVPYPTFDYMR